MSAIDMEGRAVTPVPSIVVNFRSYVTGCGTPTNCSVEVADTVLRQGQGMHGSFGRGDTMNFMAAIGPDFKAGCISCSAIADGFNGIAVHLANHDVMLCAASRAPLPKIQAFKRRMGWTFPWASSHSSDFNYDFNVSITEEQQRNDGGEYNYRRGGHAMTETTLPPVVIANAAWAGAEPGAYVRERPGLSAFVLEDGVVYHTYSTYARGLDGLWGMYQWLDRAPRGRNENGVWWRHHDSYDQMVR
jgi:predicted dithiol-disulfide oxidoreductase (DUF899 family)